MLAAAGAWVGPLLLVAASAWQVLRPTSIGWTLCYSRGFLGVGLALPGVAVLSAPVAPRLAARGLGLEFGGLLGWLDHVGGVSLLDLA